MTTRSSQFAQPRINLRALLGLYDPADATDWGPIRAAQLNAGREFALFLLGSHLIGAAMTVLALARILPLPILGGWAGLLAIAAVTVTIRRLSPRRRDLLTASVGEVRATIVEGAALGLLWATAPLCAGIDPHGAPIDRRFDANEYWARVAEWRPTWLNTVPAILASLARQSAPEVTGIRFARSASAPLHGWFSQSGRRSPSRRPGEPARSSGPRWRALKTPAFFIAE